MVVGPTPTIAKIKNEASEIDARALLYIAVCEVCDFFNVGKTMSDAQVALTVDIIIEQFHHLKLDEIKFCFRRAMTREQLYDRIDGNIICRWLESYEKERSAALLEAYERQDRDDYLATAPDSGAMGYAEYLATLQRKADNGDTDAAEAQRRAEEFAEFKRRFGTSAAEQHRKDVEFFKHKIDYIQKKS